MWENSNVFSGNVNVYYSFEERFTASFHLPFLHLNKIMEMMQRNYTRKQELFVESGNTRDIHILSYYPRQSSEKPPWG